MSSNLEHVLTTLKAGDTVTADFSNNREGAFTVSGKVRHPVSVGGWNVAVGNTIVGHSSTSDYLNRVTPATGLTSITVVERAAKPVYTNRAASRKPTEGDVAMSVIGGVFYFDGGAWICVNRERWDFGQTFKPNDPKLGTLRLVSESTYVG